MPCPLQGGVEGRTAFEAAQQGDETALMVCRTYVSYLADGLVSLINILRPEVVAIGGGVAAAPDHLLLDPLREIVSGRASAAMAAAAPGCCGRSWATMPASSARRCWAARSNA